MWPLFGVLAALLVTAGVAAVVWGPGGWEGASYALGVIALISAGFFTLEPLKKYTLPQFSGALAGAVTVAALVSGGLYAVLDARPDEVTEHAALDGGTTKLLTADSPATRLTVKSRPDHGSLHIRLTATNKGPGTSCVPRSRLEFGGSDVKAAGPVTLSDEFGTKLALDSDSSQVRVDIRLLSDAGCKILLELKSAEYR